MRVLHKCRMRLKHRNLCRDEEGSLTVEAMLVLPVIFLLMVLFLRWGLILQKDLHDTAALRSAAADETVAQESWLAGVGFLHGGPPARRIRDADLLIDIGYSIKERLPVWFRF